MANQLIFLRELLAVTAAFYAEHRKHPSAPVWSSVEENLGKDYGKIWAIMPAPSLAEDQDEVRKVKGAWGYIADLCSGALLLAGDMAQAQGFNRFVVPLVDKTCFTVRLGDSNTAAH